MISHDRLRLFDRWVGVPLCALTSIIRRSLQLFPGRASSPDNPKQVLFVQLAESGSMVLADPAMREMAAYFGARLHCVTFATNAASLSLTATIPPQNVFAIRSDSMVRLVMDGLRFLLWCRRQRIDTVVDCELFSRLTAVLCLLTGAARRAGFQESNGVGLYRGDLYSHPVAFNPRRHIASNYMALAMAFHRDGAVEPVAAEGLPFLAPVAVAESRRIALRARLDGWLPAGLPTGAPLLLINANASDLLPQRRWPAARFAELARNLLAARPTLRVLLIGAAGDRKTTAAVAAAIGDRRCADIAGRLDLAELPALFSLASALVTNDSGPAHFASVTALPTVVLFGPETPALFGPLNPNAVCLTAGLPCSPCVNVNNQRRTRCTDNRCMTAISVLVVGAAVEPMLGADAAGSRSSSDPTPPEAEVSGAATAKPRPCELAA